MEVLSRDPASGATPVVYYIVAGNQLVPARVVAEVTGVERGEVAVTFTLVCVAWKRKKRRNRVLVRE